jgi:hypothetical protein
MWIRSQDKEILLDVNAITKETTNKIFGWISGDCYFNIGQYDTDERALQIVDEIHKLLVSLAPHTVFEMPEA